MAINRYVEDDPNKKVSTAGISPSGTPSVAPSSTTPVPVPLAGETNNKGVGITVEKGPESSPNSQITTIDEELIKIKNKLKNGEPLTPEEQNLFDGIEQSHKIEEKKINATTTQDKKTKLTEQQREKLSQYRTLEAEGGTDYEKTSRILDKYLSENEYEFEDGVSYQSLKEKLNNTKNPKQKAAIEKQLRAKRDKVIHDWQAAVNPDIKNGNLSLKDRQRGIREIGKIFMHAGANDIKGEEQLNKLKDPKIIKDIKSNKTELSILSEQLHSITYRDENGHINADNVIRQFAELRLEHDKTYQSITDKKLKEEYLQNKIASAISDSLGYKITKEDMQNNKRVAFLKQIMAEMAANAIEQGIKLENLSSQQIISIVKKDINKIKSQIEQIPDEETKIDANRFLTHLRIASTLKEDATELDVYNVLKAKAENGTIKEEEKDLFETLDKFAKTNISLLNQSLDIKSAVSMSIIMGEDNDKILQRKYDYVMSAQTQDARDQRFAETMNAGFFHHSTKETEQRYNFIEKYAKDCYNGDIKKAMRHIKHTEAVQAYGRAMASNDINAIAAGQAVLDSLQEEGFTKQELKDIENYNKNLDDPDGILKGQIDSDARVQRARLENPNSATFFAALKGYNMGHSEEASVNATNYVAQHCSSDYASLYTQTNITSCSYDPQRQLSLGKKLLDLHNAAITEGVAAAEKHVDASVRDEYSRNLTNEINSGHYTDAEKQNFQTARETGQTSYEREQATKSSSGEETKSPESNPAKQTSGSSQSSSARQGSGTSSSGSASAHPQGTKVTTGTIYVTSESKTYARELKATLAMLDSENKKAEAMKKVAENIAKIQAESIKYAEKAEKKKTEEQQKLAQSIKEENEKKTEDELKAELSSALDTEIAAVEQEISATPEAQEVQKQFGELFSELRSYAKAGQIDQVFSMLSKIPKAQEKFLEKLATKHISTIAHFLKGADKSVLKFMCEKNPGIISTLDTNTLMVLCDAGFPKTQIIKFGEKNQVAAMFKDLQGTEDGRRTLGEFYEVMGIVDEKDRADASDVVKKNGNVAGDDDYMDNLLKNMKRASREIASSGIQGTVVPNWKEPEKRVPKQLWG